MATQLAPATYASLSPTSAAVFSQQSAMSTRSSAPPPPLSPAHAYDHSAYDDPTVPDPDPELEEQQLDQLAHNAPMATSAAARAAAPAAVEAAGMGSEPDARLEMEVDDDDPFAHERIYPPLNSSGPGPGSNGFVHHAERSEDELARISEEIEYLERHIEGLRDNYHIVDKLGEGTFSSVYKAVDVYNDAYVNDDWIEQYARSMVPGALPVSMCEHMATDQAELDAHAVRPTPERRPRYMRAADYFHRTGSPVYVALKRIFVTSSPRRIYNELEILALLRGGPSVSHLITAWRCEDQVIAVMPYARHVDFRDFFRKIPLSDLRYYFRSLFSALEWCHKHQVMHRDVKPGNFLYNPATGTGTLCDFGLAEIFDPSQWRGKCHHSAPTPELPHGETRINADTYTTHTVPGAMLSQASHRMSSGHSSSSRATTPAPRSHVHANIAMAWGQATQPGYPREDQRPSVRANRAGTRGFRAPEVLLKCTDQTVAIDIWAVGVIMLGFLTKRFPLFNAVDDIEALMELGTIFGKRRMEQVALLHNRTFICNVPTIEESRTHRVPEWIEMLNPHLFDASDTPDPKEHLRLVHAAVDMARVCMHLDCTRRWTAKRLLDEHPFLQLDAPPQRQT